MPDTIKSVLFVDYDSINRSLRARNPQAAERFGERANAWVAAVEAGRLLSPRSDGTTRRRILMKRCYADPKRLGKQRDVLAANGFEMVDCPLMAGHERNSADINMSLDALDALEHPTGYDEFILLSADADLTAVLLRLRAHNRSTVIYASATTAASYKGAADAAVEEASLLALLTAGEAGADAEPPAAESRPKRTEASSGERADIETLARKISAATSVPLFSPRTFADLFRALTEEIAANGYHFQATAESVAAKLTAGGRSATRRQVVFVVKGLALKGHVFSTTDTPERLAEVFREQVLYLAGNAGLTLDDKEKGLLSGWIIGRATASTALELERMKPAAEAPHPAKSEAPKSSRRRTPKGSAAGTAEVAPKTPAAKPAAPTSPRAASETRPAPETRPTPETRPAAVSAKSPEPPKRVTPLPRPIETLKPVSPPVLATKPVSPTASAPKPGETPKPTEMPKFQPFAARLAPLARTASAPPATPAAPGAPASPAKPPPSILARPTLPPATRPALTPARPAPPTTPSSMTPARPAPSPLRPASLSTPSSLTPSPAPSAPSALRPSPMPPPARSVPRPLPAARAGLEADNDAIESSILAAIAQAVDVLVENSGAPPAAKAAPPSAPKKPEPAPAPPPAAKRAEPTPPAPTEQKPEPAPSEPGDSDDIGDEIQRIIASYSRNRQSGERG